ncbi:MAG: MarR family transcriptional regulator, partial [Actinomycetota bacterium]|nr:MarR family transcriptional regulator [Actinomycetota bacterium]
MTTTTKLADGKAAPAMAGADTPADELAADLRLAVGRLSRRLRQHAVGGLSPSQVSAMASLDCHGPVPIGRLSRLEGVSAPTMTRIVDRLEQQGLVRRRIDPADGRSAVVGMTPHGTSALARLRHERTAFLAGRLAGLDEKEVAALAAALPALRLLAEESE